MAEIIPVIVFFFLIYLIFKMLGRYIWPTILFAVIAGVLGALFGKEGTWTAFALGGAALGFIITLVVDFSDAWRTLLGVVVGGAVGLGITYFIGNNMWASDAFLACIIVGGAITSSAAFEDLTRESTIEIPAGGSSSGLFVEEEKKEEKREPSFTCDTCVYYTSTGRCTIRDVAVDSRGWERYCSDYGWRS